MFFKLLLFRLVRFIVSCIFLTLDIVIILYIIAYNYAPDTLHHSPLIDWFIRGFITTTESFGR